MKEHYPIADERTLPDGRGDDTARWQGKTLLDQDRLSDGRRHRTMAEEKHYQIREKETPPDARKKDLPMIGQKMWLMAWEKTLPDVGKSPVAAGTCEV